MHWIRGVDGKHVSDEIMDMMYELDKHLGDFWNNDVFKDKLRVYNKHYLSDFCEKCVTIGTIHINPNVIGSKFGAVNDWHIHSIDDKYAFTYNTYCLDLDNLLIVNKTCLSIYRFL